MQKKNLINALGSYGKESIPRLQYFYDLEIDYDIKNYIMDIIVRINRGLI